jgi:hypothetical protein
VLLHASDLSLSNGIELLPPNPNGLCQVGIILLTDAVVRMYAPRPATESISCQAYFRQMRWAP